MTIDRSELFRLAWALAKQDLWSLRLPASRLRGLFRGALSRAWAEMKRRGYTRPEREARSYMHSALRQTVALMAVQG